MMQGKPGWLRVRVQGEKGRAEVEEILKRLSLHTVCEQAGCPNLMECFGRKTATFMILGRICTRNCTFCNIEKGDPQAVDADEPLHVANAVKELGLKHAVITSVTRDDLPDGGAGQFAKVVENIKSMCGNVAIEVLIPDFKGDAGSLAAVVKARPDVINHNIETVPGLYPSVRPMAVYKRSLELLKNARSMDEELLTKSGIMIGLGEKEEEIIEVFRDLRNAGCDLLTVGQYLAPSKKHHPVVEYIHPDVFKKLEKIAYEMGFRHVASGPLVRSSYHAEKAFAEASSNGTSSNGIH